MKLIDQLRKKLESIGATLDDESHGSLYLDAPPGYVWECNGCTVIAVQWANNGGQTWLAQALREDKDRWESGLDLVTDPERLTEIRYDLDEDEWGATEGSPERIEWPK